MSKKSSGKVSSPPAKKAKTEAGSSAAPENWTKFLDAISARREKCAADISRFKFNKNRCRLVSESMEMTDRGGGILYWMSRDQRVQGSPDSCPIV